MKKKYINKEFESLGRFYGGSNRLAVKNYIYSLYEKLGSIDYKKPFALYCNKKMSAIFQPTRETANMQFDNIMVFAAKKNGGFYYFGKDQETAVAIDGNALLKAYSDYLKTTDQL